MVSAHLRGLLTPFRYTDSVRDKIAHEVVLDSVLMDIHGTDLLAAAQTDAMVLASLKSESIQKVMDKLYAKLGRSLELSNNDIYGHTRADGELTKSSDGLSLLKLFKLAKKHGILNELSSRSTADLNDNE